MFTTKYPPRHKPTPEQAQYIEDGETISYIRYAGERVFPRSFEDKYGNLEFDYGLFAFLCERDVSAIYLGSGLKKTGQGDGMPVFSEDLFNLVDKRGYAEFAKTVDHFRSRKALFPLDRLDLDAVWLQFLVKEFDRMFDDRYLQQTYLGKKFRDYQQMKTFSQVQRVMQAKFAEGIEDMLSAQTEKYWKEKAAAIQGITGWAPTVDDVPPYERVVTDEQRAEAMAQENVMQAQEEDDHKQDLRNRYELLMGRCENMGITFEEAKSRRDEFDEYLQPAFNWGDDDDDDYDDGDDPMEEDYYDDVADEREMGEFYYEADDVIEVDENDDVNGLGNAEFSLAFRPRN